MRRVSSPGVSALAALALLACGKPKTPQAVAEAFIDRYYIERNHAQALALATGMAASRVAAEKKLVDEGQAEGAGSSAVQPHIYYRLRKTTPRGAELEWAFDLSIDSGGVLIKKEVRIVTSNAGPDSKVSFFNETDVP